MPQLHKSVHHSASVELALHVDGQILPVAKAGEHRVTLVTATAIPPGDAKLVMNVDGRTQSLLVLLPHGATPESAFIPVVHQVSSQPIA